MKENEYRCAMCGKVYKKRWTEEEAWAEHDRNFPGEPHETAAVVCDDCYKAMVAVRPPPGMPPDKWASISFDRSWWWHVLHSILSRKMKRWAAEFEAFLNTDEQREKFEKIAAQAIIDGILYGGSRTKI